MKGQLRLISLLFTILIVTTACSSDDDSGTADTDDSQEQIESFVTPELLSIITELGFEVNAGNNPPNVEGTYLAQAYILEESNIPTDVVGTSFAPLTFTFFNQNNTNLTIEYSAEGGNQTDEGSGSLISGQGNRFSVFLKTQNTINDHTVEAIYAVSGEIEADGISNLQTAGFLLDDNGDPNEDFIENNQGRILVDADGFSERQ